MLQPNGRNGGAADGCAAALLLIDVINDLACAEGESMLRFVLPMAEKVAALKARAKRAGLPCVYVNDNFGRWRSDFREVVEHCRRDSARCRDLAEVLVPEPDDYFVLKPQLSGFYATALDPLLRHLGVKTLILTGLCANVCVLFTAADAHMRGYQLCVPTDCVATTTGTECGHALDQMRRVFKADVRPSADVDLEALARAGGPKPEPAPGHVAVDAGAVLLADASRGRGAD